MVPWPVDHFHHTLGTALYLTYSKQTAAWGSQHIN